MRDAPESNMPPANRGFWPVRREADANCKARSAPSGPSRRIVWSIVRALPAPHQPINTSRPCTSKVTRAPTGRVTLVGTCPKGNPVRSGVEVNERTCCTAAFMS